LAARAVRRFVHDALAGWGQHEIVEDAELVVSELASNVLLHTGTPFLVSISLMESTVRISVHDASPEPPEQRQAPLDATSGRGVGLVDALCGQWSTVRVPDGKIVWAELDRAHGTPPTPPDRAIRGS
jgi:anti-sigma regulatory factor (Ser/Thr protein kinase)